MLGVIPIELLMTGLYANRGIRNPGSVFSLALSTIRYESEKVDTYCSGTVDCLKSIYANDGDRPSLSIHLSHEAHTNGEVAYPEEI